MRWLVAMLALALAQTAVAQTDKDLIGYWPFDEGVGVTARDQAGKNDFRLIGNPVWTRNASGYCLLFDGSDDRLVYGVCEFNNGYRGLGIFAHGTMSVWTQPVAGGHAQTAGGPAGRVRVVNLGEIHVGMIADRWCALAYDFQRVDDIKGPLAVDKQWTHLALTWDEVYARFFVNGREVTREEGPYLRCDLGGRDISMWDRMFVSFPKHHQMYKGYVDDWKLFKRALAPAEIVAEYEREKGRRTLTAPNANGNAQVP